MKKLILITIILLLACGLMGQTRLDNRETTKIITSQSVADATITGGDTSFIFTFHPNAQVISISGHWTHSGGSGYLYFDVSNDKNIWAQFDATSTDTITGSDTTFLWDANSIPMAWKYGRIRVDTVNAVLRNFYITLK